MGRASGVARPGRGPHRAGRSRWGGWQAWVAGGLGALGLALLSPALAWAGDVQLLCEPGLRVFLDGRLVGVSTAREDGLFLVDVPSGLRTLRVEKDGFLPQTFRVEIPDHPVEIRVGEFVPEPLSSRQDTPAAGAQEQAGSTVVITSAPQNCEVVFLGTSYTKRAPQLVVPGVPPGEHGISFFKEGFVPISGTAVVRPGVRTAVRGNLLDGKVDTLHQGKGSLRVLCRPDRCNVRFLGRLADTARGRWNLSHIPAGVHRLVVAKQGREVAAEILIADQRRTVVAVSFLPGDEPITVTHEPE